MVGEGAGPGKRKEEAEHAGTGRRRESLSVSSERELNVCGSKPGCGRTDGYPPMPLVLQVRFVSRRGSGTQTSP